MSGPDSVAALIGGDIYELATDEIRALHAAARARLHASYPSPGVPRAGTSRHGTTSPTVSGQPLVGPRQLDEAGPVERGGAPAVPLPGAHRGVS